MRMPLIYTFIYDKDIICNTTYITRTFVNGYYVCV